MKSYDISINHPSIIKMEEYLEEVSQLCQAIKDAIEKASNEEVVSDEIVTKCHELSVFMARKYSESPIAPISNEHAICMEIIHLLNTLNAGMKSKTPIHQCAIKNAIGVLDIGSFFGPDDLHRVNTTIQEFIQSLENAEQLNLAGIMGILHTICEITEINAIHRSN